MNMTHLGVKRALDDRFRGPVVGDFAPVRQLLWRILDAYGASGVVGSADTGRIPVRLAGWLLPNLVPMNVMTPGKDGLEATRRITTSPDPLLLLTVTRCDTPVCRTQAEALGTDGFVSKATLVTEPRPWLPAAHQKQSFTPTVGDSAPPHLPIPDPPQP